MVQPIMKDPIFLAQKSIPATQEDLPVAQDLLDTLAAHADGCVGMAANMIGVTKRIIVFDNAGNPMVMFNPELIRCKEPFTTEESCLSLSGVRKTKRYRSIKVQYQNMAFQTRFQTFTGWTAQIIQHEIDHCNGILI
ncbi:MAG: peptide deformylase [Oscillospiraceae bacterium]